jgi:urease accessory protein
VTAALQARAAVRAERAGGVTRLATLRSDPPVTLRATAGGTLYLAASAAGPVGGDQIEVDVEVGAGADLEVRTVAATLLLPGPGPAPAPSTLRQRLTVGAGAELRWLPEPVVAVRGCDHRATARIELAESSRLVWREELVLGRHAEAGGSVLQRLEIDRAGSPLLRTEQALGPLWAGSTGPAGSGGFRAVGLVVLVGPDAERLKAPARPAGGALAARADLACGAALVSAVAESALALAAVLDAALADVPFRDLGRHRARTDK